MQIARDWGTRQRPNAAGLLWIAALLLGLCALHGADGGLLLVPPFAATATILLYLPEVSIAQPFAVIVGATAGAAIGTAYTTMLGFGTLPAVVSALTALIILPLLRAYHPPGVALAMYPALLHPGFWFALRTVLPFCVVAVASAAWLSRRLHGWRCYPRPLGDRPGPA